MKYGKHERRKSSRIKQQRSTTGHRVRLQHGHVRDDGTVYIQRDTSQGMEGQRKKGRKEEEKTRKTWPYSWQWTGLDQTGPSSIDDICSTVGARDAAHGTERHRSIQAHASKKEATVVPSGSVGSCLSFFDSFHFVCGTTLPAFQAQALLTWDACTRSRILPRLASSFTSFSYDVILQSAVRSPLGLGIGWPGGVGGVKSVSL